MVFVKVRETYDLHTIKNKMSVIAIHTPDSKIIKANFPGLLMQCKAYRPYSADVKIACASVLPVDPLGVGLTEGSVAPEDMFNPILYKACSNFGMSQIEARLNSYSLGSSIPDVAGPSADVEADDFFGLGATDQFQLYYGLLSNAHEWKHANPQSGLSMCGLKPLVYEVLANIGDGSATSDPLGSFVSDTVAKSPTVQADQLGTTNIPVKYIRGNSKPMPMINCTAYSPNSSYNPFESKAAENHPLPQFQEFDVPAPKIVVGCIIVPPSRQHELFYRMVVEWTLEFSMIRPLSEVTNWAGLETFGDITHFMNYDYTVTKEALTGDKSTVLESDVSLSSANVDLKKVM